MAQPTTTFLDELTAALRGYLALLTGRREAPGFFDFSQRGLVGSFIAVVIGVGLTALHPQAPGEPAVAGAAITVLIFAAMVVGVQYGVAWLVLRLLGRGDGLVPFMVVQNWGVLFQAIVGEAILLTLGPPIVMAGDVPQLTTASFPLVVLAIAVIVIAVNVARLILTLRPMHVVLFVGAQFGAMLVLPPMLGALL